MCIDIKQGRCMSSLLFIPQCYIWIFTSGEIKSQQRDFTLPLWKDICMINNGCWKYRIWISLYVLMIGSVNRRKKSLYHGKKYLWKITGSDLKQSTCRLTYLGNHYSYGLRKERFLAFKNMNWYLRTWLLSRSFLPCEKHNCCEYNIPTIRRKIKHYCTYLKTGANVDLH